MNKLLTAAALTMFFVSGSVSASCGDDDNTSTNGGGYYAALFSDPYSESCDAPQYDERKVKQGIASVAAIASIPQTAQIGKASAGIGLSSFGGNTGVAVGTSYRLDERTTFKAAISKAGSGAVLSGGASIDF